MLLNKEVIMKIELIKNETRGAAEHGWLHSRFSFSFAEYYNPERMGFGLLRVLNDDIIEPGKGFGFHPHNNMEIISIPLSGRLEHRDSMGNTSVIQAGDIQVMSAGTGIVHSEMNPSLTEPGNFLQIWILPKVRNISPGYRQMNWMEMARNNDLLTIAAPEGIQSSLYINQDAYIAIGKYTDNKKDDYTLQNIRNGVFLFVIEGKITVNEVTAEKRDALQIAGCSEFAFTAEANSHVLVIEVPMK